MGEPPPILRVTFLSVNAKRRSTQRVVAKGEKGR